MEKDKTVSNTTIRRLTKYYRYIEELNSKNVKIVSSYTLGKMMGISPSLIRQDFNAIGEFGRQGHGYQLDTLKQEIGNFLGLNKVHNMIVIGAGNLGQTLANYDGFDKVGFPIKALFDINPKLIGMKINGVEIIDLDNLKSFIKNNNIDIGILCVRKHCVQEMTDILVDAGIKGIWNFSATDINVPDDVKVENVNFSNSLFTLSYLMNDKYNLA
ncbi:redox-sensing transcriptional repressor Rex [Intestinibacter bartlettii]|uniref:Redox-sensing transcriptional repressor Rex n=1 Tax=Intestinibacter bartlettii TaxID=261299 RepID=A0ABS6DZ81_9FIRM|nr:redox-sensing transcriptional repressor Rex [Intestinibacter bartlettii]MBU5336708.1 redox-sensing transcriptional repressor Rex [Intestinibacter bartlettii]MDO5010470.1 redox-sensing transcriptional repressor Rex [Intestinibacter bartlettii]